jgi:hypothetical protein
VIWMNGIIFGIYGIFIRRTSFQNRRTRNLFRRTSFISGCTSFISGCTSFVRGCTSFMNRMCFQNFWRLEICPGWSHASRIRQGWLGEPGVKLDRRFAWKTAKGCKERAHIPRAAQEETKGREIGGVPRSWFLVEPLAHGGTPSPASAQPTTDNRQPTTARSAPSVTSVVFCKKATAGSAIPPYQFPHGGTPSPASETSNQQQTTNHRAMRRRPGVRATDNRQRTTSNQSPKWP